MTNDSGLRAEADLEHEQRRVLRRHQRFASACLVVAGLLYLATQFVDEPGFWLLLIRAGAEAGLIGGIADWFAVTALFRRPWGLPIPHTAILPRNKDRLGLGLGRFVARHFLAPDVVQGRLRESKPAERIGGWLARRENSALMADRLLAMAPDVLNAFNDREVRAFYRDTFRDQVGRVDPVPLAERFLRTLMEGGQHQQLFDRSLRVARELLLRNKHLIYQRVEERSSWWIPRRFDRRLAEAIIQGVEEWLGDLSRSGHPAREEFDRVAWNLVIHLKDSPVIRERLEGFRDGLLASPELQQLLETAWDDLRESALSGIQDPHSRFRHSLVNSLQRFGQTLLEDEEARERLDERMTLLLREIILPFRETIGGFIADVVRDWDTDSLSDRLELAIGRDLQFIRVNGTLVGAMVGMVLFISTRLVFG
ncbi:MAG: DUF445 domain-containing protein [Ectothiorhodospiraceae bacterium]|nr:DUF445 domain-containing protein [Ectothiorhodospiraceae bacterium]